MSIDRADSTTIEALKLLRSFSCSNNQNPLTANEKNELRQALLLIVPLSDWQNLGICADNSQQGLVALAAYLERLGYPVNFALESTPSIDEPVYLKFNSQKMSYYIDTYNGEYRGVLVACQGEDDRINGTYGHFPLDLFV
jgi:Domain of unknown function (DUF1824)